jgi:hypothetical protein
MRRRLPSCGRLNHFFSRIGTGICFQGCIWEKAWKDETNRFPKQKSVAPKTFQIKKAEHFRFYGPDVPPLPGKPGNYQEWSEGNKDAFPAMEKNGHPENS